MTSAYLSIGAPFSHIPSAIVLDVFKNKASGVAMMLITHLLFLELRLHHFDL